MEICPERTGGPRPWYEPRASRYNRLVRTVPCPRCRKPSPWEGNAFRPFCSERCRMADLGAWLEERYRIPGDPIPPTDGDDEGY